jgi:hypothetical protein
MCWPVPASWQHGRFSGVLGYRMGNQFVMGRWATFPQSTRHAHNITPILRFQPRHHQPHYKPCPLLVCRLAATPFTFIWLAKSPSRATTSVTARCTVGHSCSYVWTSLVRGRSRSPRVAMPACASAFAASYWRCFTMHGTDGALAKDNTCFDVHGSGFYIEVCGAMGCAEHRSCAEPQPISLRASGPCCPRHLGRRGGAQQHHGCVLRVKGRASCSMGPSCLRSSGLQAPARTEAC